MAVAVLLGAASGCKKLNYPYFMPPGVEEAKDFSVYQRTATFGDAGKIAEEGSHNTVYKTGQYLMQLLFWVRRYPEDRVEIARAFQEFVALYNEGKLNVAPGHDLRRSIIGAIESNTSIDQTFRGKLLPDIFDRYLFASVQFKDPEIEAARLRYIDRIDRRLTRYALERNR